MDEAKKEPKKLTALRAIRLKCLDCSANSSDEVKMCPVSDCPLFVFRKGKNPNRPKRQLTPEQRAEIAERFRNMRTKRKEGEK